MGTLNNWLMRLGLIYILAMTIRHFFIVNGPIAIENETIQLEYINENDEREKNIIKIDNVRPYGLGWIDLTIKKLVNPLISQSNPV